jgi:hypothetical protein
MMYNDLLPGDVIFAGFAAWMVIDVIHDDPALITWITWMTLWSSIPNDAFRIGAYHVDDQQDVQNFIIYREGKRALL